MGPRERLELRGVIHSDTGTPKVPFSTKKTKMPLVNLGLGESQTRSKSTWNNTFHIFSSNPSFSEIFSHFDQFDTKLTLGGPKSPNFDSAIGTGWNQCHYKDYQILIPMTIHGSKLELEQPRYHKNRVNAPIDAPLTSRSHNFWSNRWIFEFHTFLETENQDLSRGTQIHTFLRLEADGPWRVATLKNAPRAINSPKHPTDREDTLFFEIRILPNLSTHLFFSLPNTKKHPKHTSKFLDSSLFAKNTRYCSYTQSSFPWFYTLDLRFRGVDVAFLAIIHTPNLLNLFLSFILLLCLNNTIYCFSGMLLALFVSLA